MNMVQVCITGMLGVLFAIILKQQKPEYSMVVMIGTCCILFAYAISYIESVISVIISYGKEINNDSYITIILKVIGITYVCEFCSNICKDAGYGAIASQVELFGKVAILFAGMPIMIALFELIGNI